jgi:TonB family protein
VQIEDDGHVSASSVDRVDPPSASNLNAAALAALKTWSFNPARERDKPVASTAIVPVVFGPNPSATPPIARLRNRLDPVRVTPTRS